MLLDTYSRTLLVLLIVALLLSAYNAAYFSWLTATPLSEADLMSAKSRLNLYASLSVVLLAASLAVAGRLFRDFLRKRRLLKKVSCTR
jgi:hypothetical protein